MKVLVQGFLLQKILWEPEVLLFGFKISVALKSKTGILLEIPYFFLNFGLWSLIKASKTISIF